MIQEVEGQQNAKVFGLQVDCLKKRANNLERELTEAMEKHEREMKAKEDLCFGYKEDLEREVKKSRSLQEDIRDYEDKLLQGLIPPVEKGGKSPSSIAEAPKSKRINIEDKKELKIISVEVDVLSRVRPPPTNQMTSAYTQSVRDDTNRKTSVKDPLSIRATAKALVPTAR
jgi:hypothetical protein